MSAALQPAGLPAGESPFAYCIAQGEDAGVLGRISEPSIGLALWRRALPSAIGAWLGRLSSAQYPGGRILVPVDGPAGAIPHLFGAPHSLPARLLAADIIDLAARFALLAQSDLVDLRLEAMTHDGCWRFHKDRVRLRLLATYCGPATQIVAAEHAAQALRQQRAYDGPIEALSNGDVALFKGDHAEPGSGVVHRSPPVQGTGAARLLLCLNLPSAASPPEFGSAD